jgi:phage terminase large subunit
VRTSELYTENLNATEDIIINQGGTSSGKTYSIMQVLFSIAISQENKSILVVGQSIPNLKVGALTDAQNIVASSPELQSCIKSYNKTDRIYEFHSGSTLQFKSFLDFQDAKSGKRDYSFFNEVNGIPKPIFDEIHMRTRIRTWVDYNPNEEFWIHQIRDNPPDKTTVRFIRSWHEHNPFLSQKIRDKIEGLKQIDEDLYQVYARGKTGKIEGLVFRNWSISKEVPEGAEYIGSWLDFGFTNDPTASGDVWMSDGELYLEEKLYQTGLTNQDIYNLVEKDNRYVADSAEPKSIEELRRMGLKVEPALKGKDSINTGIDILKRYKINLIGANLVKEFSAYKWKPDRQTNQPTNTPVDFMNHHIDGIRYVALNKLKTNSRGKYTFA